jgi:hypothetical protein
MSNLSSFAKGVLGLHHASYGPNGTSEKKERLGLMKTTQKTSEIVVE